jgi:aminomethyltransferase
MTTAENTRRTPLFDEHVTAGGRMVPFAGFLLPSQYTSLAEEHTGVRARAGLFDVSHMGEIVIRGPHGLELVQRISCNDHSKLAVGRAQYTGLMYPEGTFVDDVLVHRTGDDEFLLVVNAANAAKDFAYLSDIASGDPDVEVLDRSDDFAQLALQGPLASEILQPLTAVALDQIKYYRFTWGDVAGHHCLIARTGYTGEDGFELYLAPDGATDLWRALIAGGKPAGLLPAGLGARDTLRLEAGMPLYGNDIDHTTTPYEAGLGRIVKLEKGDFIGRDLLERQQSEGVTRQLVGFEMVDRGIARHGYPVLAADDDGPPIGNVTSGTKLPTLGKAMGMAYLPIESTATGQEFFVDIRGRAARARVVELPFYSRRKKTP